MPQNGRTDASPGKNCNHGQKPTAAKVWAPVIFAASCHQEASHFRFKLHVWVSLNNLFFTSAVKPTMLLTHIVPSCHVFAYNGANTRMTVLINLISPNYEFGKGQYAFYPMKLSRFAEKI